jgi:small subunit ribosomal protein S8
MDALADSLNAMKVAERKGVTEVLLKPASKLLKQLLLLLQDNGLIGEFEVVDDGRSGKAKVKLLGKINDCGVIKPRLPVNKSGWEKYEEKYLPARETGVLIVSTDKGLTTHTKAKEMKTGGRIVAFVY